MHIHDHQAILVPKPVHQFIAPLSAYKPMISILFYVAHADFYVYMLHPPLPAFQLADRSHRRGVS